MRMRGDAVIHTAINLCYEKRRPETVLEHRPEPDHNRYWSSDMAVNGPAHKSGDRKECAHCGAAMIRKQNQNGINWTRRRFCSVQCSNRSQRRNSPPVDLAGQRFGRWVVASYAGRDRGRRHLWDCCCDCGSRNVIEDSSLKCGNSKSCGCAQREASARAGAATATHGMSKKAPEYYVWSSLKQRCLNPNVRNWSDYGGRGIKVCDRWKVSFEAFYADMGPRPSPHHSIDRLDNDGDYEPSNCCWRELGGQVRNRRSNIRVVVNGVEMILTDAAAKYGVKYSTALARYHKGWSIERVLELAS